MSEPIRVTHQVPRPDLALGLVVVEGVHAGPAPAALSGALEERVRRRQTEPLSPLEEALRKGCRDVLRNGRYKPTGRGKPASEYLLRAAKEDSFPRINGPVDANNLVSLATCLPISLWDLDLAQSLKVEFRLGAPEERYVFNSAGQTLELEDLVCGCMVSVQSVPAVTPIKDSMATKTTEHTTRVAGCIYYPLTVGDDQHLQAATTELMRWLITCGDEATGAWAIARPGESVELPLGGPAR